MKLTVTTGVSLIDIRTPVVIKNYSMKPEDEQHTMLSVCYNTAHFNDFI